MSGKDKISGVYYAQTRQNVELPIVDITHPTFTLKISKEELQKLSRHFAYETKWLRRIPMPLYRFLFCRSPLGKGLLAAAHGYLSGMNTYLFKIGSNNMKSRYFTIIDRRLAKILPAIAIRLRLQDIVQLIVEGLIPLLQKETKKPLCLINIAGGPAIDSLNALIVLAKRSPELLQERRIEIHVMDLDEEGPEFGERALNSLKQVGAPLNGFDIHFFHHRYDWSNVRVLEKVLEEMVSKGSIIATSTEGGLFEYASDEIIVANLKALLNGACCVVGSVTREVGPSPLLFQKGEILIHPRTLESFNTLVDASGWKMLKSLEGPLSYVVSLIKSSS